MFLRLLLLFITVPFVELVLLLWVSDLTSWWFTVALLLLTGVLGAALAKRQGFRTWRRIQEQLALGQMPTGELLDGLIILVAATLLITPGLLTDATGFLLLVPAARERIKRRVGEWLRRRVAVRFQGVQVRQPEMSGDGPTIIDAEFTRHPGGPHSRGAEAEHERSGQ